MTAKTISHKEIVRRFRKLGYSGPFGGGRHLFMVKGTHKIRIPNPHHSKEIHIGLMREILRQAGIDPKTWDEL